LEFANLAAATNGVICAEMDNTRRSLWAAVWSCRKVIIQTQIYTTVEPNTMTVNSVLRRGWVVATISLVL